MADTAASTVRVIEPDGGVTTPPTPPLLQPEDVAWLDDRTLVIADTWNHRVLVTDSSGGGTTVLASPDDGWYGPRSVAVAPDGWLAVSDTGHHRVVLYDERRDRPRIALTAGSRWGDLLEPGGVAWLSDGSLVVCDTGHRRVLHLDRDGRLRSEVAMPEAWTEYYSRPQVVAIDDTTWMASDTPAGAVWLIRSGRPERLSWPDAGPTGIGHDPMAGTVAIADLGGRVWLLEVGDG